MLKALPFLWFLLAAVGVAAHIVLAMTTASSTYLPAALTTAGFTALFSTVHIIGIALVYMLILRTRPSPGVAIIGYSHLFLASAAYVGQAFGTMERARHMSNPASTDLAAMGFADSASALASILGGIVFILALIVALNTHHVRPEDVF
ncbi:MAG: hypothetical protein VR75_13775 [Hyphomonadaceae bacterium BRH_c29]|nr:MAG: hypothetical protein VR75_13775 [Hyphomonadaceae bacterium BRH_c29]